MRISDWSSDVCSSDLHRQLLAVRASARRAPDLAGGALRQAAARDRAPAEFHSPLQGQGQQGDAGAEPRQGARSEEHTSELQSLMRTSYAVFCLKNNTHTHHTPHTTRPPTHTHTLP